MELKSGARLRSQVCSTEVIVVRPVPGDVDLTCGGHPMVEVKETPAEGLSLKPELAEGSQLGKRYTSPEAGDLEILVTKAGEGSLALGTAPLPLKEARPLPSSD
jgi:hypothetical protein